MDFDQLKIENQQYMEKIELRNNELLKLKLSTSRTVQVRTGRQYLAIQLRACTDRDVFSEQIKVWSVPVKR